MNKISLDVFEALLNSNSLISSFDIEINEDELSGFIVKTTSIADIDIVYKLDFKYSEFYKKFIVNAAYPVFELHNVTVIDVIDNIEITANEILDSLPARSVITDFEIATVRNKLKKYLPAK